MRNVVLDARQKRLRSINQNLSLSLYKSKKTFKLLFVTNNQFFSDDCALILFSFNQQCTFNFHLI